MLRGRTLLQAAAIYVPVRHVPLLVRGETEALTSFHLLIPLRGTAVYNPLQVKGTEVLRERLHH